MPYIEQKDRDILRPVALTARTAGELNYQLTCLAHDYWHEHGPSYQAINDIVGALEGAKAEFQRRIVADYEDVKIAKNGDIEP